MVTQLVHMPVLNNVMWGPYRLDVVSLASDHRVGTIGTVTLEALKPLPPGFVVNARISATAGYENGEQGVIFAGKVVSIDNAFDDNGTRVRIEAEGYLRSLRNGQEEEIRGDYLFGYKLSDFIRLLLAQRGVPTYLVDEIIPWDPTAFSPTYAYIRIAGNSLIGPESNRIPGRTSLLSWASQILELYGYRIYDAPDGTVRVSRVSGLPSGAPVATFTEGDNFFRISRSEDASPVVNWFTVYGARFLDNNGITIQIRNSPAVVPNNPDLDPPGYRHEDIRHAWIQNDNNARCVRAIAEIDRSTREEIESFETWGQPNLSPGDVIRVISPSTNPNHAIDNLRWVLGVSHRITESGEYTSVIDAWAGNGSVLPQANDCSVISLGSGATYHLGDQVRSNFDQPNPVAKSVLFPITVANTYTSMSVHGIAHGTNHGVITSSTHTPRDLSRMEVWQGGNRVSSIDLPVFFDSLTVDYSDPPDNWQGLHLPIAGSLSPGAAEIRFIAGEDLDLDQGLPYDEFELRGLTLRTCGVGTPVLP